MSLYLDITITLDCLPCNLSTTSWLAFTFLLVWKWNSYWIFAPSFFFTLAVGQPVHTWHRYVHWSGHLVMAIHVSFACLHITSCYYALYEEYICTSCPVSPVRCGWHQPLLLLCAMLSAFVLVFSLALSSQLELFVFTFVYQLFTQSASGTCHTGGYWSMMILFVPPPPY